MAPEKQDRANKPTEMASVSLDSAAQAGEGPPIGSRGNGRYLIERGLGRGGIGVVYLARDQQLLSKRVVVKTLLTESLQNAWVVKKFRQEMEALTRFAHPGIVSVLDAGETAEDHHAEDLDRDREGEILGADTAELGGIEDTSEAGKARAQCIRQQLDDGGIDAHRRGGNLVLSHGHPCPTQPRVP